MQLIKSISRRSENGGRFLQICPGWHDFRLAEHRNEERSEGLIRRVGEIFHGNIEAALTRVAR